jgi:hypothetical protein
MVATHFGRGKKGSGLTIANPGERRPADCSLIAQIHNVLDARLSG